MNNKTIEKAVKATITAINTDGRFFEPIREVVQAELENQIDALRKEGEMIDSDPIMEDINITFETSYAPADAKLPTTRELLGTLADFLEEVHLENQHEEQTGGTFKGMDCYKAMKKHQKEEPDCSYCKAIAQARALLINLGVK